MQAMPKKLALSFWQLIVVLQAVLTAGVVSASDTGVGRNTSSQVIRVIAVESRLANASQLTEPQRERAPPALHDAVRHTGGAAIIKGGN